ncbi:MAG: hypothetical protein CBB60_008290 [Armatimonadetes bacterium Cent15-Ar3]|nr:MAG: hypothetical protein CBB60_008290 [Armatimonadetes bacterium Cent15-Ar3]
MRNGFTLVELLIVITLVAVLAAIAIPRFSSSGKRSKETALRASLKVLRQGVGRFFAETGGFPARLTKLDDTVSGSGNTKIMLPSGEWEIYSGTDVPGPFVDGRNGWREVSSHPQADGTTYSGALFTPIDPVSNKPFKYVFESGRCVVRSSANGNDSQGVPYSSY